MVHRGDEDIHNPVDRPTRKPTSILKQMKEGAKGRSSNSMTCARKVFPVIVTPPKMPLKLKWCSQHDPREKKQKKSKRKCTEESEQIEVGHRTMQKQYGALIELGTTQYGFTT